MNILKIWCQLENNNIIYYLLFIVYYLLFIIYYLLFIIYYLLFIIIKIKLNSNFENEYK